MKYVAVTVFGLVLAACGFVAAQPKKPVKTVTKPIIFAVLHDGAMIEPIAYIDKGKLWSTVDGGADGNELTKFNKTYYTAKTSYRLIFGGSNAGLVTVKDDPNGECSPNMAQVTFTSTRAKLKGMVMGLATNALTKTKGSGVRRLPTAAERAEIEALVRAEFTSNKIDAKTLKYHNLTALDVDGDGKVEIVGSFWVDSTPKSRGLLFFIADKGSDGKYSFGHSEFETIEEDKVMSGEIKDVDGGVYHELLLDSFDYDGDGVGEIFTYTQSFEGAGFNAYRRESGKWNRVFEDANYHCGY